MFKKSLKLKRLLYNLLYSNHTFLNKKGLQTKCDRATYSAFDSYNLAVALTIAQ